MQVLAAGTRAKRYRDVAGVRDGCDENHRSEHEISERNRRPGNRTRLTGHDEDPRVNEYANDCCVALELCEIALQLDSRAVSLLIDMDKGSG